MRSCYKSYNPNCTYTKIENEPSMRTEFNRSTLKYTLRRSVTAIHGLANALRVHGEHFFSLFFNSLVGSNSYVASRRVNTPRRISDACECIYNIMRVFKMRQFPA